MSKQTQNTAEALLVPSPMFGAKAAELLMRQCLDLVEYTVDGLIERYENEGTDRGTAEEETAECHAYSGLLLVRDELKRLIAPDTTLETMQASWWQISGVINMVAATCPKKGTTAGNDTAWLVEQLDALPGLWQHVEERPRYVTRAPGQQAANGGRVKQ
ncbi:MAG: hypothetical protein EPN34_12355 [Burkholderiaceae bacterium]|nr:MAG: hypothetical protein EPN34_12355 [Burkholderiaceae bacterium]